MLGRELEGFIFSLLLLGMLFGLFAISQLTGLIKLTLETFLFSSGFLISFSSFFLAIFIIFFFRKKIAQLTEARFSTKISHQGGAIVGFMRGFVISCILIIVLSHFPFRLLDSTLDNSLLASQINTLFLDKKQMPVVKKEKPSLVENEPEELIIGY